MQISSSTVRFTTRLQLDQSLEEGEWFVKYVHSICMIKTNIIKIMAITLTLTITIYGATTVTISPRAPTLLYTHAARRVRNAGPVIKLFEVAA